MFFSHAASALTFFRSPSQNAEWVLATCALDLKVRTAGMLFFLQYDVKDTDCNSLFSKISDILANVILQIHPQ